MPITIQHNPFSTRFTRPGQLLFQLPEHENLDSIFGDFRDQGFLGQIVGSHGSGKTTLTHALEPLLREAFHSIRRVTVRNTKRVQGQERETANRLESKKRLLIIDGFERLPWLHRRLLLRHASCQQMGLLITTHRPLARIPIVYQSNPTFDTFERLSRELAPGVAIESKFLVDTFETNQGNIRESLMTLYNWFESRPPIVCSTK